jgi:NAD(P)-dependent dehydrogenase (short-subunit alcohol dehydrogenase family)
MAEKKTALITGANKGIAFEASRQLGKLGFKVLLGSRDEESGRKAVAALENEGIDAHLLLLDVTKQDTINNAVSFIEQEYGSLDVLLR